MTHLVASLSIQSDDVFHIASSSLSYALTISPLIQSEAQQRQIGEVQDRLADSSKVIASNQEVHLTLSQLSQPPSSIDLTPSAVNVI